MHHVAEDAGVDASALTARTRRNVSRAARSVSVGRALWKFEFGQSQHRWSQVAMSPCHTLLMSAATPSRLFWSDSPAATKYIHIHMQLDARAPTTPARPSSS